MHSLKIVLIIAQQMEKLMVTHNLCCTVYMYMYIV